MTALVKTLALVKVVKQCEHDQTPYKIYLSQIAKCICLKLQMYLSQNVKTSAVVKEYVQLCMNTPHTTHNPEHANTSTQIQTQKYNWAWSRGVRMNTQLTTHLHCQQLQHS